MPLFDISEPLATGRTLDLSATVTACHSFDFSSDGLTLFVLGDSVSVGARGGLFKFTLTSPFDITTATYANQFLDLSDPPFDIGSHTDYIFRSVRLARTDESVLYFSAYRLTTGTVAYNKVVKIKLTNALDLSSYDSYQVLSNDRVQGDADRGCALEINDNDTVLYTTPNYYSYRLYKLALAAANDLSSATSTYISSFSQLFNGYASAYFYPYDLRINGIRFADSGNQLFIASRGGLCKVSCRNLPYDLSSSADVIKHVRYQKMSYFPELGTEIRDVFVSSAGASAIMVGDAAPELTEYSLSQAEESFDISQITYAGTMNGAALYQLLYDNRGHSYTDFTDLYGFEFADDGTHIAVTFRFTTNRYHLAAVELGDPFNIESAVTWKGQFLNVNTQEEAGTSKWISSTEILHGRNYISSTDYGPFRSILSADYTLTNPISTNYNNVYPGYSATRWMYSTSGLHKVGGTAGSFGVDLGASGPYSGNSTGYVNSYLNNYNPQGPLYSKTTNEFVKLLDHESPSGRYQYIGMSDDLSLPSSNDTNLTDHLIQMEGDTALTEIILDEEKNINLRALAGDASSEKYKAAWMNASATELYVMAFPSLNIHKFTFPARNKPKLEVVELLSDNPIELGLLTSTVTSQLLFLNNSTQTNTVVSIQGPTNAVTFTNLQVGTAIPAGLELSSQVTVPADIDPALDLTFAVTFDNSSLPVTFTINLSKPPVWALPHNWDKAISATYQWKTSLTKSLNSVEMRRKLRGTPRVVFKYSHLLGKQSSQKIMNLLRFMKSPEFIFPEWMYETTLLSDVAQGSTVLSVDNSRGLLKAGGLVVVNRLGYAEQARKLLAADSSSVTIEGVFDTDLPAGTKVIPAFVGLLSKNVSTAAITRDVIELSVTATTNEAYTRHSPSNTAQVSYSSEGAAALPLLEYFDGKSKGDQEAVFTSPRHTMDIDTAKQAEVELVYNDISSSLTKVVSLYGSKEIDDFMSLLGFLSGRYQDFWVAYDFNSMLPYGDTVLVAGPPDKTYFDLWDNGLFDGYSPEKHGSLDVLLETDGSGVFQQRYLLSVSSIERQSAEVVRIGIDGYLEGASDVLPKEAIKRVSLMTKATLLTDKVQCRWVGPVLLEATLSTKNVHNKTTVITK